MKKIIIVSRSLELGGAERALIELLNCIDYEHYEVDLFLCRIEGEFVKFIPKKVNVLPMNEAQLLGIPIKKAIEKKQWSIVIGRFLAKIHAKLYNSIFGRKKENHIENVLCQRYTFHFFSFINPDIEYDLAISFLLPHYIVTNKVNAKKKIAWIHTDYSSIVTSNRIEKKMWDRYDYIVSISDNCSDAFLHRFPSLEGKIIRIDNILTEKMVSSQAKEFIPVEYKKNDDDIILCSVGRISTAKNFDNVPEICSRILKFGIRTKWYIIGAGGIETLVRENIKKYKVEDNVFLLGKKDNPYPYIKGCDFYVQPSRYEGKAVAVREAQILKKPVIITNYATSASQLTDGYDGIIVPMDNEGCAKGIADFIRNKTLQEKIISNLEKQDYSNADEVEKIYALME